MKIDRRHHPILALVIAPFDRLREAPAWGYLVSFFAALGQAVMSDMLTGILVILVVASAVDWYFGGRAALKRDDYDRSISDWGFQSKVVGILLMMLVRFVEYWLYRFEFIDTAGMVAAALTLILVSRELESIDKHRQELGGQPIPLLTSFLALVRRIPGTVLPKDEGRSS